MLGGRRRLQRALQHGGRKLWCAHWLLQGEAHAQLGLGQLRNAKEHALAPDACERHALAGPSGCCGPPGAARAGHISLATSGCTSDPCPLQTQRLCVGSACLWAAGVAGGEQGKQRRSVGALAAVASTRRGGERRRPRSPPTIRGHVAEANDDYCDAACNQLLLGRLTTRSAAHSESCRWASRHDLDAAAAHAMSSCGSHPKVGGCLQACHGVMLLHLHIPLHRAAGRLQQRQLRLGPRAQGGGLVLCCGAVPSPPRLPLRLRRWCMNGGRVPTMVRLPHMESTHARRCRGMPPTAAERGSRAQQNGRSRRHRHP